MNEKFYNLSAEKRKTIINSGFRVFSQNSYKKSPVSEIAADAGISKSLLFHYFKNKKEFYMFLWSEGARITQKYLEKYDCYKHDGFFEQLRRGLDAKVEVMKIYPDLTAFIIKAFYENNPEVFPEIQKSYQAYLNNDNLNVYRKLDPADFAEGIDLDMMYREIYYASSGYVWDIVQRGAIDVDRFQEDYNKLIDFWKKIYGRKKG